MKIKCTKVEKDQEDGSGYGDDKNCNLNGEIILSTCVCPGFPGTRNHKMAKSQECLWCKKMINVPSHQVPQALTTITEKY
eukprot:1343283-Ditylum_brightwellii.AAC.1